MQILQIELKAIACVSHELTALAELRPTLVLVFGAPAFFEDYSFVQGLIDHFPDATIAGCSTAGEISRNGVGSNGCVITAVRFDHTAVVSATTNLEDMDDSAAAGRRLADSLRNDDLKAVLVFGQGVRINGSALIQGLTEELGPSLPITGGLAGDNGAFVRTWTIGPAGVSDRAIVAIGLRGEKLTVGHGSFGGWEPFGPARKATRFTNNVLYELDGEPALAVYKRYLGDYAKNLPASGLLFPFAMLSSDRGDVGLIRTILGINEADGSLILAGDIDTDGFLRLMHASTEALVNGAETAAEATRAMSDQRGQGLAILVSCVGRKLVMGDRVEEEVDAVVETLGRDKVVTGFYSYGEISPMDAGAACKLHNQTMTITCLSET